MDKQTIAFIGTGVMGSAMAGHLLDAGYDVVVSNRTKSKAEGLIARGARWAQTPDEAARLAEVVITMVGYPSDVEEVYFGDGEGVVGIIDSAPHGALLIDMTTSSPALAERIHETAACTGRGIQTLDAPVSGGDIGARNATLTIMAGGGLGAFDRAVPIFSVLGKTIAHHGAPGLGQHCKMANQIAIAASMLGLAECLAYAERAGLNPQRVIETLSGGSAQNWSLANYGPRVLAEDFDPGFFVKHFIKDLRIALAEADAMGLCLPGTALAEQLYDQLSAVGGNEFGTQAICLLYADSAVQERNGIVYDD